MVSANNSPLYFRFDHFPPPKKQQPQDKSPKPRAIATKNHSKSVSNDVGLPAAKRSRHTLGERNFDGDNDLSFSTTPRRNDAVNQLLNRPQLLVHRPEPQEVNMDAKSKTLESKNIQASPKRFGFLGLGIMGTGIVKNLIDSGHQVVLWNRTHDKCEKFKKVGAEVADTPSDVIDNSDITFSCVSDPTVAKQVGKPFPFNIFSATWRCKAKSTI